MTAAQVSLSSARWHSRSSSAGFTLAEILMAMAVLGLVGAGLAQFSISTSKLLFDSTAKVDMSGDVRTFTTGISQAGRSARTFYIYPQYASGQLPTSRQRDGGAGDFLVFVWVEPDTSGAVPDYDVTYFSRIVGYGRSAGEDGYGPVVRFEQEFPQLPAFRTNATSVEALIDVALQSGDPPRRVVELARGLANQRLFYNFRDNSVVVNGQILHGNKARSVTNTYNFTVTPRG